MLVHRVDPNNSHFDRFQNGHFVTGMTRISSAFPYPIRLRGDGSDPLYRQLYAWFRGAILGGRLRPGQRMPSTRSLAAELRVSRTPVLIAFEQLHAEGYLQTRTGAGTQVATALPRDIARDVYTGISRQTRRKRPPRKTGNPALAPAWHWDDPWLRHTGAFRIGLPAIDGFPTGIWSSLLSRHARKPGMAAMGPGNSMGYGPLRKAIAEYLGAARAVRCEPEQVMVVNGSQHGLQIAARALLREGDPVWLEEPGYAGARSVFTSVGANLVPVPVDSEGLDVEAGIRLERAARVAYVTPSHQFPMGATMSVRRRLLLLDWAELHGAWVFEDDYDSEYRFVGSPVAALQSLDVNSRVIHVGSFSKVLFPGLRMGYMVIPEDLVASFRVVRQSMDVHSPLLFQLVSADFMREGHFARHLHRMKRLYMHRREACVAALREQVGEALQMVGEIAGMHVTTLSPRGKNDVRIARELADIGISAWPLSICHVQQPARNGLLLGYANTDTGQIWRGAAQLAGVLRRQDARGRDARRRSARPPPGRGRRERPAKPD